MSTEYIQGVPGNEHKEREFRCRVHGLTTAWMEILGQGKFCLSCLSDFLKKAGVEILIEEP